MTASLIHRGPDAQDIWVDDAAGVALGHTRLSIIDLSPHGAQPMSSENGRYVIVYNGEIYNSDDLRDRLGNQSPKVEWRGRSDTEVLLATIERRGIAAALNEAEGMFAFGLWDRLQNQLYLARDRAGEKPLYYGWTGGEFVFASELKAIRSIADSIPNIDRLSLAKFTELGYIPAPRTIYKDLRKLEPGSWILIDALLDTTGSWPFPNRYWTIEDVAADAKSRPISNASAAIDVLDVRLGKAVGSQMASDVPLGAFLSGGVDSSLIVALMQARSAQPVRTFTVAFDEAEFDESHTAAAVAEHLGTNHQELRVRAEDAQRVIPLLPEMFDEPFADVSQIPTYLIAALARQHVAVALSGDGGDELFGGYNRYRLIPRIARLVSGLSPKLRGGFADVVEGLPRPVFQMASHFAGSSTTIARRASDLAEMLRAGSSAEGLYSGSLKAWSSTPVLGRIDDWGEVNPLSPPGGFDIVESMMLWDYRGYMTDDVLVKVDRASMAQSLEVRCPFLDPHVTELAWQIPISIKIRDSAGKWPLRQLLHRYVPADIVDRPKAGFSVPVGDWIRGPLRDWAESLLSRAKLEHMGFFDADAVRDTWEAHLGARKDYSRKLWPILIFNDWHDHWH